jgi:hypothetical protein
VLQADEADVLYIDRIFRWWGLPEQATQTRAIAIGCIHVRPKKEACGRSLILFTDRQAGRIKV